MCTVTLRPDSRSCNIPVRTLYSGSILAPSLGMLNFVYVCPLRMLECVTCLLIMHAVPNLIRNWRKPNSTRTCTAVPRTQASS